MFRVYLVLSLIICGRGDDACAVEVFGPGWRMVRSGHNVEMERLSGMFQGVPDLNIVFSITLVSGRLEAKQYSCSPII